MQNETGQKPDVRNRFLQSWQIWRARTLPCFALDSLQRIVYSLPGKTQTLALSHLPLAFRQIKSLGTQSPRPSACLGLGLGLGHPWVTLGSPKGHPRATQASRKGRPSVELKKCFVCNKTGKRPGGGLRAEGTQAQGRKTIARIAKHRRN